MYFPLQVVLDNRPRRHPYFLNSQSHMFHQYPHITIIPLLLVAVLNASFGAHVYLSEEMKLMDPMCQELYEIHRKDYQCGYHLSSTSTPSGLSHTFYC